MQHVRGRNPPPRNDVRACDRHTHEDKKYNTKQGFCDPAPQPKPATTLGAMASHVASHSAWDTEITAASHCFRCQSLTLPD
mmetsp:Transcript_44463/g.108633  ORF Transcript_44463/g.108633 Transcript_44463/m.108633 type:complete len:81 (+) Transcript_44463:216-458(+)